MKTPALGWAPYTALSDGTWEWRVSSLDARGKVLGSSSWQRFSVDASAPKVTSKSPTGIVRTDASFVVKFSEPVTGVNARTFTVKVAGTSTRLLAKVTLNAAGTKATLNPTANLKSKRKYTLKLTSGIKDNASNPLTATQWTVTAK